MAFEGHDLSEEYGDSTQTKGEIIDGYRQWIAEAQEAIDEFESDLKAKATA